MPRGRFATIPWMGRAYLQASTAHALRRSGWATQWWSRIFWLVLFVGACVAFVALLITLTAEYTKYPVKAYTDAETSETLPFPSVTVCNMNPVKKSQSLPSSIGVAVDNILTTPYGHSEGGVPFEAKMRESAASYATSSANGFGLADLVVYCTYGGKVCYPPSEFVMRTSPLYGNCMTFNEDGNRNSSTPGPDYGLRVVLNVWRDGDMGGPASVEGFRVFVNQPGSALHPDINGFAMATGIEARVGMRVTKYVRLPEPYSKCDATEGRTSRDCNGQDGCLPPCLEYDYDLEFSLTDWPSANHYETLSFLLESINGRRYNNTEISSLRLYYMDFSTKLVAEEAAITFTTFLSQVGGLSGLTIGFSVLTVLEFFEMCFSICNLDEDGETGDFAESHKKRKKKKAEEEEDVDLEKLGANTGAGEADESPVAPPTPAPPADVMKVEAVD